MLATATLALTWTGRSGRDYAPVPGVKVRHGRIAAVRKVVGVGPPRPGSTPGEGDPLALKVWIEGDDVAALEVLQAEARVLGELMNQTGDLPCPRLYDLVGDPVVTGLVMEWCPGDLERWWREKLVEPDALGRLMATMSEVARRVSDYQVFYAGRSGLEVAHGDLKPGNILLSAHGRWLLSDFGAARVRPPQDSPWASSDVVMGTENFLAPEVLFHARRRHPAAIDTWGLGAVLFGLLRLQRMVLDGEVVPRNGTLSPRFRTGRMAQVLEVYRNDPSRFLEQDIDGSAFQSPLRLPDADRRAVRDALRGAFGDDGDEREDTFAAQLLDVLERCLSVDPAHRYTAARDLAAAFEGLTRSYIGLTAQTPRPAPARRAPPPEEQPTEVTGAKDLELTMLRAKLRDTEARLERATQPPPPPRKASKPVAPRPAPASRTSPLVVGVLALMVLMQVVTLVVVGVLAGMVLAS